MMADEKNAAKAKELDLDELEKVAGGTSADSNDLPPFVPENEIDAPLKKKV